MAISKKTQNKIKKLLINHSRCETADALNISLSTLKRYMKQFNISVGRAGRSGPKTKLN